ncbi:hypothetical protein GUJ93_ZPchr0001g31953 [Zizania palustris]|uniref:Trafficking protein particle complex subunit n=1 Tax=Zizania palustris TaxID=103762 RepID=A0A8J5V625_ZIZPA|nr:hypothetical protein GUJ93_ZPchr0001g31953 [Zizania palustris]
MEQGGISNGGGEQWEVAATLALGQSARRRSGIGAIWAMRRTPTALEPLPPRALTLPLPCPRAVLASSLYLCCAATLYRTSVVPLCPTATHSRRLDSTAPPPYCDYATQPHLHGLTSPAHHAATPIDLRPLSPDRVSPPPGSPAPAEIELPALLLLVEQRTSPVHSPAMQFFGGGSSLTSVGPEASPAPAAPPGTGTGANAQVLYVFNRGGVCLLYREWHRPLRTLDPIQDQKLMFGLLFSLRSFTAKIDPTTYASLSVLDRTTVFAIYSVVAEYYLSKWLGVD